MNPTPQILVVDDDPTVTALVDAYLPRFGMAVHAAGDGASMQRVLDSRAIDLVVLDLVLPDADGLTLAASLRAATRIPIIMLTGNGSTADRVVGLEMGADDYMVKPFEPRELVARIQSVLRRTSPSAPLTTADSDCIRFDGWRLVRSERRLTSPAGVEVALSNAEYRLLATFLKAPQRVVGRDQLIEQARGRTAQAADRGIDMLISRLRHKLTDGSGAALIETVRGAGYRFAARSVQPQR